MHVKIPLLGLALLVASALCSPARTEYFVALRGDDANDGLSRATAFRTIQKGVDALTAGDILTIGPGEYFENVRREQLGNSEAETVIRAQIPGTVLLRGDVPAPEFRPVAGYRYVYAADFDREVRAVNEVDTLTIMETAPNVAELEFSPGGCTYDATNQTLYISTSDLQPPDRHHYTVSVTDNYGLFLYEPVRVVVEGLAAAGYNPVGIALITARDCVVRQCTTFRNSYGIVVDSGVFKRYAVNDEGRPVYTSADRDVTDGPGGNTIADCRAYGNYSSWGGGNIIVYNSNNDLIRDCVSFGSPAHGIRHYGMLRGPATIRDSLEWGNPLGMDIKGGDHGHGLAERCVSLGGLFNVAHVSHNLTARENRYNSTPGRDNIRYDLEAAAIRDREFADPDNMDFRLQADSQFRGTGLDGSDRGPFAYATNIFYVRPDGDDQADGLCMARAWKTLERAVKALRPGDTLYLAGGAYQADVELTAGRPGGEPVHLRGRGTDAVLITGALRVADSAGLSFERLNFGGSITLVDSRNVSFNNCRFRGAPVAVAAKSVADLRVTHAVFTGFEQAALELADCSGVFIRGNIFDNRHGPAVRLSHSHDGSPSPLKRRENFRLKPVLRQKHVRVPPSGGSSPGASAPAAKDGRQNANGGLRLDQASAISYSDYNAYRSITPAWVVDGKNVAWESLPQRPDRYSRVLAPQFRMDAGRPVLTHPTRFAAGGALGMPLGVYSTFRERPVRVSRPIVHSLTPTTANVEWMTSRPALCEVAWGEPAQVTNGLSFNVDGFGSLSLTGLRPGTTYRFQVTNVLELSARGNLFNHELLSKALMADAPGDGRPSATLDAVVFKTPEAFADPVTYYVAPDGDDTHDGLGRDAAFRSIMHAANRANAGDTVMIAGGTYNEIVYVRATGLPDRPITFRSIPGERAILHGDDALARAFVVNGKQHLRFDGLYFRNFNPDNRTSGIFRLYRSGDVHIERCFYDGRSGYSPSFVMAYGCPGLVIRNCAAISAFYGNLYLVKCPGVLIENNALVRSLIQQCVLVNEPDEKIRLRKNILTDNVPHKVMVALVEVACKSSLLESDNAYYLRIPADERDVFMFYDPVAYGRTVEAFGLAPVDASRLAPTLEQVTLPEFHEQTGNTSSLAVNPGFAGTVNMAHTDQDGKPVFLVDHLLGKKDLDFPDLFATEPAVVDRGIGLQPEAFGDFHFNTGKDAQ